ncbi:MAG: GTP 3',8-cyclase MoaA [Acidimicrobiia bacterium]
MATVSRMQVDKFSRGLKDLRISVTDRCTFRCVYCMPREIYDNHEYLPRDDILTYDEISTVVEAAVSLGVQKVRLTGGEPLLRRQLDTLVNSISDIDGIEDLALTTNGHLLAAQAEGLAEAGLDRVTVSLDGLDDEVVRRLIDTDVPVSVVLDAIDAAEEVGLGPVKINTVVRRGWNEDQVIPLVEHFRNTGHTLRFIEYMDVGSTNKWDVSDVVTSAELVEAISAEWPVHAVGRTDPSATAQRYQFEDGGGTVAFISSVSEPFCGDCSRLRLSAEGSLYTCLFATNGTDLKAALRDGADVSDIAAVIADVWSKREDRYSEDRGETPLEFPRIEMSYIGG